MPASPDVLNSWLRETAVLGLALVFLAVFLLGVLWVFYVVVTQLKKWIPLWFQTQIEERKRDSATLERMGLAMDRTEKVVALLAFNIGSIRSGVGGTVGALRAAVRGMSDEERARFGIDSDVVFELEGAVRELGKHGKRRQPDWHEPDGSEQT
jgi:hypothetical protein